MAEKFFGKAPVRNITGVVQKIGSDVDTPLTGAVNLSPAATGEVTGIFLDLNIEEGSAYLETYRDQATGAVDCVVMGEQTTAISFTYLIEYTGEGSNTAAVARQTRLYPGDQIVLHDTDGYAVSSLLGTRSDTNNVTNGDSSMVFLVTSVSESQSIGGNRTFSISASQWGGDGLAEVS